MEAELARLREQVAMLLERSSMAVDPSNSSFGVQQQSFSNLKKAANSSTDSGVSDEEDFETLEMNFRMKTGVPFKSKATPPVFAPPPAPPVPPPPPLKLDLAQVNIAFFVCANFLKIITIRFHARLFKVTESADFLSIQYIYLHKLIFVVIFIIILASFNWFNYRSKEKWGR